MPDPAGFRDELDGESRFFPACDYPTRRKRHVRVNGVDLWVEEEGEGPPLLLIHGGPGVDHRSLHPGLSVLAGGRTLVYFDLRGHYMSSESPAPARYGPDVDADDAEALRAALGLGATDVLGHSYGGIVALSLASRHPAGVRRVVATSCPVGSTDEEIESRMARDPRSRAVDEARTPAEREERYLAFYHHRPPDPLTREIALRVERCYGIAKHRRMLEARADEPVDWPSLLARVRRPVLFLYGRDDPIVDGDRLEGLVGGRAAMSARGLRNCRHEVFSDRPRASRETVLGFLDRG